MMQVDIYRDKIRLTDLPRHVLDAAEWELHRMERVTPGSSEYAVISNYLDWLVSLPWTRSSEREFEISAARKILDEDILGMTRAKEQILEIMAAVQNSDGGSGRVLCLTGPPGMGMRALARSVARALGRKFAALSIEEIRDESEIRGEWRVNVGNRPGFIIRSLRECNQNDPVVMIERIDHHRVLSEQGLESALLEILHPDKNPDFHDRYLNVPFDLSGALFVTTTRAPHLIPDSLRDIMEVIRLPGYTNRVKASISNTFIIPKRLERANLKDEGIRFSDDAIQKLIQNYTYEVGVHQLDKQIELICRRLNREKLEKSSLRSIIDGAAISKLLGLPTIRPEMVSRMPEVGITTALKWSESGGNAAFIEAIRMVGTGIVKITGNPPTPVEELVEKSLSYIRSHAEQLEIPLDRISNSDIHLHFPPGIAEQDCRSLGLPVIIDLVSLLTEMPVHHDFAFTGEITLHGKIYPVEGIEEKAFGAHRSYIQKVFLPSLNEKDVVRLPDEIRNDIEFVFVDDVAQAIEKAVMKIILPNKNLDQSLESITNQQENKVE
jgi:ATP-dependent Lon protease